MSNIKIMASALANKIAAGEVVLNPASVVKELIENAIDAGSSIIKIDLIESGVKEIKVTDNGSGMTKEDAKLCFERHATSKLFNEEDLFNINTLGFRGEALPSIASVSKVELKTGQGDESVILNLKDGIIIKEIKGDAKKGTIITIKELFYNTPARLKYLKSLQYELAITTNLIQKMMLSKEHIKISLTNNGKTILKTTGSKDLLKTINEIYGSEVTKNMIKINNGDNDFDIKGYISKPVITRSNRNHMHLIVNGRIVKNQTINRVINEAYHTYKPENKYPISVIKIETDPSLIDINIHPAKEDIKFSKLEGLKELILKTIKAALEDKPLIPEINTIEENNEIEEQEALNLTFDFSNTDIIKEPPIQYETNEDQNEKIPYIEPVGITLGTYLIFQNEKGMYLIDQHAAKERINYERYLEELTHKNQGTTTLLMPLTLEYPKDEYMIIMDKKNVLDDIGIAFEEFGINTIVIKEHPIWIKKAQETESLKKIIDIILEKGFDKKSFIENVAITLACKLSIKANQNVTIEEMINLVNDLRRTNNPYTCPHGRPTTVFYPKYDLEKLFKRAI